VVPALPGKALSRQLPFRGDDGIFEDEFIEDRRKGLEQFINKYDADVCLYTLCLYTRNIVDNCAKLALSLT